MQFPADVEFSEDEMRVSVGRGTGADLRRHGERDLGESEGKAEMILPRIPTKPLQRSRGAEGLGGAPLLPCSLAPLRGLSAYVLSTMLLWFAAMGVGCEIGHGIAPTERKTAEEMGTIRGKVTFLGTWPDSTAEVRVAVYGEYPPSNFFADLRAFSDPLPLETPACEYTVSLPPGTYEWVIVVWRKEGTFWGPESLIGTYCAGSDTTRPGAVTVVAGEELGGINITADFDRRGVLPPELEDIFGAL